MRDAWDSGAGLIDPSQQAFPIRAEAARGKSRGKEYLSCWTFSCWPSASACLWRALVTPMPVNGFKGRATMIFDYSLAGLVSIGLLFYLTYALLRPERF